MKRLLIVPIFLALIFFTRCAKSGCDNCKIMKEEYCKAMRDMNCNSAFLTTNMDNLLKACGKSDAESYRDSAILNCTNGTLTCTSCE